VTIRSQGRCETTGTIRYFNPWCKCPTYPDNLGPCAGWEQGGNGRCVYCDHDLACHAKLLEYRPEVTEAAAQKPLPSPPSEEE
jgi:hypothetical protein